MLLNLDDKLVFALFFGLVISVRSDWEMGRAVLQIIGTSMWKGMFGSHGQITVIWNVVDS